MLGGGTELLLPPPQLTIRTTIPNNSRASGAFLRRNPGIANTKTPASTPKPNMPVVAARIAEEPAAAVLIVTGTVTALAPVILALVFEQVAPVMDVGTVQTILTEPVKPPLGVTVTCDCPGPPGAVIVTLVAAIVKLPVTVELTVMGTELLCPAVTAV